MIVEPHRVMIGGCVAEKEAHVMAVAPKLRQAWLFHAFSLMISQNPIISDPNTHKPLSTPVGDLS